jgi:hypothetical protein
MSSASRRIHSIIHPVHELYKRIETRVGNEAHHTTMEHMIGVLSDDGIKVYTGTEEPTPGASASEQLAKKWKWHKHPKKEGAPTVIEQAIAGEHLGEGVEIGVRINREGLEERALKVAKYFAVQYGKTENEKISPLLPFLALLQDYTGKYPLTDTEDYSYQELKDLIEYCRNFKLVEFTCHPKNEQTDRIVAKMNEALDPKFQTSGLATYLAAANYAMDQTPFELITAPLIGTAIGLGVGSIAERIDLHNSVATGLAQAGIIAVGDDAENISTNAASVGDEVRRTGVNELTAWARNVGESTEGAVAAIPLTALGTVIAAFPNPLLHIFGGMFTSVATSGGLETRAIDIHHDYTEAYTKLLKEHKIPPMTQQRREELTKLEGELKALETAVPPNQRRINAKHKEMDRFYENHAKWLGKMETISIVSQRRANVAVGLSAFVGLAPLMFWAASETELMLALNTGQQFRQVKGTTEADSWIRNWAEGKARDDDFLSLAENMKRAQRLQAYSEFFGHINRIVTTPIIWGIGLVGKTGKGVYHRLAGDRNIKQIEHDIERERKKVIDPNFHESHTNQTGAPELIFTDTLKKAAGIAAKLLDSEEDFQADFLAAVYRKAIMGITARFKDKRATKLPHWELMDLYEDMTRTLEAFNARYGHFSTKELEEINAEAVIIVKLMAACVHMPKGVEVPEDVSKRLYSIRVLAASMQSVRDRFDDDKYRAILYAVDALNENAHKKNLDGPLKRRLKHYLEHPPKNEPNLDGLYSEEAPRHADKEKDRLREILGILETDRIVERILNQNGGIIDHDGIPKEKAHPMPRIQTLLDEYQRVHGERGRRVG